MHRREEHLMNHPDRRARRSTLTILVTLAVALAAAVAATAAPATPDSSRIVFHKEPYLIFSGVGDEMQVLWQLWAAAPCTLDWGTDTTYSLGSVVTSEYATTHQHTYTFTELPPYALYYYRVRAGGESRAGSFHSAPAPDASRLKFLVYGDTRSSPATHDAVAAQMISTYEADPEYQTLVAMTGDLVYSGNAESDWDAQFFSPSYAHLNESRANIPTESARGNHEGAAVLFAKYFPYPFVQGRAWSFDYGPAHFIIVDQYIAYSHGSNELAWIENDLATTDREWKFIVLHEPGWSAGGDHPNNVSVQTYLQPLCVQYGVQIVFGGHNHYYARAVVDGIQHITTGGGGAPLYIPNPTYPSIVATAQAYHFCKVEIDGDSLVCTVVRQEGQVLDTFTVAPTGVGGEGVAAKGLALSVPAPNPSAGAIGLSFTLPDSARVRLTIYDERGRILRTVLYERLPAGDHQVTWDGKDAGGTALPSGVYFARLTAGERSATRKVVLVR